MVHGRAGYGRAVSNAEGAAVGDEETDRLLAMPAEELFALLGRQLLPSTVGVGPEDDGRAESAARAWVRAHWAELRNRVCGKDAGGQATTALVEFSAVADAVAGLLHGPAVATLTAIIVKYGVKRLCAGDDAP